MKNLAKIFILVVTTLTSIGMLAGFGEKEFNEYNAKIYYDIQALMISEYIESIELFSTDSDSDLPKTITDIINDQASLELAFSEFPQEVDFSEKMLLVHFFVSSYSMGPYQIEEIGLNGTKLNINFKLNKNGSCAAPDASKPLLTVIVVVMDKLDITKATFKGK